MARARHRLQAFPNTHTHTHKRQANTYGQFMAWCTIINYATNKHFEPEWIKFHRPNIIKNKKIIFFNKKKTKTNIPNSQTDKLAKNYKNVKTKSNHRSFAGMSKSMCVCVCVCIFLEASGHVRVDFVLKKTTTAAAILNYTFNCINSFGILFFIIVGQIIHPVPYW